MPNLIDVRYALRLLARSPAFTLLTVIVLTGGLALSIYTYSFLNSLMFKPVPLVDGDRVVKLYGEKEGQRQLLDAYELAEVRRELKSLVQVGAYTESSVLLSGRDSSRSLLGSRMEWGFLDFVQTKPLLGRGFLPDDNADNAEPVAIIGHKLWQSMFASDPKVIDTLGWALFQAGELDRAITLLREARLRAPASPTIRYHLGAALAQAGRTAEAKAELDAALQAPLRQELAQEASRLRANLP